ncbi:hypothetical protein [Microvirga massiliensis]|uniref:hypothetical protein n=1 Tax=Microvirga massiliensis TaxID=1033741 RepID=UPI0006618694|nr:hypothetical protein [Microvirga massiliensis]
MEKIGVTRDADIPPLAWLFTEHAPSGSVICGTSVIVKPDGFFEGAWATESVGEWNFSDSPNVFGSGMKRMSEGWFAVPPSHTLECIYIIQCDGAWRASNSLPFLLAHTGAKFTTEDRTLLKSLVSIVRGIHTSPVKIHTDKGILHLLFHHNALLGKRLEIRPKPAPAPFSDFAAYRNYIQSVCSAVAKNASDPDRPRRYRLLATVSSGYDSPACAAIARSAGCTEAVTFTTARNGVSDDGTNIGLALGLKVLPVERLRTSEGHEGEEAEFFATGMQAEDFVYTALSELISGRVFVTGFHGDKVWDRRSKPNTKIKRGDISGSSLGEFRLAKDFVHLPLPFVGAQRHPDLSRISTSDEMHCFSVGGHYDRPIPRRIAEEAGVPRNLFGQRKKAISVLLFSDIDLISPMTRQKIHGYLPPLTARRLVDHITYRLGMAAYRGAMRIVGYARLPKSYSVFEHTNPMMVPTLKWALREAGKRYETAAPLDRAMAEICRESPELSP